MEIWQKKRFFFPALKCFLFVLLFCCSIVISCSEEKKQTGKVKDSKSYRKIYATHDFGDIREGNAPGYAFTYKNTTNENIKILRTRVPCGCANVKIEDNILKPGESTNFSVRLDPTKHLGAFIKSFYLLTDSKKTPMIRFVIKANIIGKPAPICLAPAKVSLGKLKSGEIKEGEFAIENSGVKELTINIRRPGDGLVVLTKLPLLIPPKGKKEFKFKLQAPATGKIKEKLILKTNDTRRSLVMVTLIGEINDK